MNKVKTILIIITILIACNASFAAMKVNGWFGDWEKVRKIYYDKAGDIDNARSGMDFEAVAVKLEKKYLYIFIKGKSLTSGRYDSGVSLTNTSIRMSFIATYNPLQRLRVATEPEEPGIIMISQPSAKTKNYGSKKYPFWKFGKLYNKRHGVEIRIPVVRSKTGTIHIGSLSGPIIYKKYKDKKRRRLCEVSITNVNTKTHLFIDKAEFKLYSNSL